MLLLAATPALSADLTELSMEELLAVEVTSVGKKTQSLSDAAAAIFVISNDDIRRSGATSVPEALRMAPGLEVKRIDANKWAISARGFSNRFANKLLVLIDGRTVYTPSFSGVYWENQDVMLADIDRIEVIRGPGATLWGANAVNGVINIITRSAAATQGGLLIAGGGNEERAIGALRYGAEPAPGTFARVYAKYNARDALITSLGDDGRDEWDIGQGGFRVDSTLGSGDRVTLEGDLYRSNLRQQLEVPDPLAVPTFSDAIDDHINAEGWNLLGRWERALSVSSDVSLQLYYDHAEREEAYLDQRYDILDLDFQHRFKAAERHDIVWGLGYRNTDDRLEDTEILRITSAAENRNLWSGFVQDEIELLRDRLRLTLGTKIEHNDYTGLEIQPNIRLLWKASEQSTLWGSVSRAVRTPSQAERSASVSTNAEATGLPAPYPQVVLARTAGNSGYGSESLIAYELGLRTSPTKRLNLDLAVFYNDYDELWTTTVGDTLRVADSGRYLVLDLPFKNLASGHGYGLELAADLQVRDNWRLALAYSYLELDLTASSDSLDISNETLARTDPRQQVSLRSLMNPRPDIDLDLWIRYVDQTYPVFVQNAQPIPAYWTLDLRLAWRPRADLELALVGQNLLSESHQEGYQDAYGAVPLEVQRGLYATVRLDF
ncbi:TonB-dependent receptor plug domain-containing protein [Thiocystis violacea]|uniref:TonB-dependent receptor plug domain-containing protein n=1 Tax=Thiocystis violacea TaxID=13725 RepID=UPI001905CED0|nr:TonB-dependent receptor [Thiocystis violacea]MBK1723991.1 TonB-dependent receptor [Thiocystis violacea]